MPSPWVVTAGALPIAPPAGAALVECRAGAVGRAMRQGHSRTGEAVEEGEEERRRGRMMA